MDIKNAGNLELLIVRFSWQGNKGVLLWKCVVYWTSLE